MTVSFVASVIVFYAEYRSMTYSIRIRALLASLGLGLALVTVGCNEDVVGSNEGGDAQIDVGTPDTTGDDVEADGMTTEPDGGSDTLGECQRDSDDDGLTDCEEASLCGGKGSNPDKKDTDDDGISDYDEVRIGTNPCQADTDGDGVDDDEERKWGLDPTNPDSDGDGVQDGEHWIFSVCDTEQPKALDVHTNQTGDWSMALGGETTYTDLQVTGAAGGVAVDAIDHPSLPVAGAVFSHDETFTESEFQDWHRNEFTSTLEAKASQSINHGARPFRGGLEQKRWTFDINTSAEKTVGEMRQEVVTNLTDLSANQVSGYPGGNTSATHSSFVVEVRTALWLGGAARGRPLVVVAVRPNADSLSEAATQMTRDLVSSETLARAGTSLESACTRLTMEDNRPAAELLFVIDGDGDEAYKQRVRDIISQLDDVGQTGIVYRYAVTNMQPANGGLPYQNTWLTDPSNVSDAVENAALNCQSSSDWSCGDDDPHGLQVTRDGLRHMAGADGQQPAESIAFRPNADALTVVISDEGPASISEGASVSDYESDLTGLTTLFAIAPGTNCENPSAGDAYETVATTTGGTFQDVCAQETPDLPAIYTASSLPSPASLEPEAIPHSIGAFADGGRTVPRSQANGFDYFSQRNTITFFGTYRPYEWLDRNERGFSAWHFRYFDR